MVELCGEVCDDVVAFFDGVVEVFEFGLLKFLFLLELLLGGTELVFECGDDGGFFLDVLGEGGVVVGGLLEEVLVVGEVVGELFDGVVLLLVGVFEVFEVVEVFGEFVLDAGEESVAVLEFVLLFFEV